MCVHAYVCISVAAPWAQNMQLSGLTSLRASALLIVLTLIALGGINTSACVCVCECVCQFTLLQSV